MSEFECHGDAETLLHSIVKLGEVEPPALSNPNTLNIVKLYSVFKNLGCSEYKQYKLFF